MGLSRSIVFVFRIPNGTEADKGGGEGCPKESMKQRKSKMDARGVLDMTRGGDGRDKDRLQNKKWVE